MLPGSDKEIDPLEAFSSILPMCFGLSCSCFASCSELLRLVPLFPSHVDEQFGSTFSGASDHNDHSLTCSSRSNCRVVLSHDVSVSSEQW